ncbi:putative bacilliredoxin, YphP/YqiW family [Mucilaginibacter sp. OK268]|uniref:BrxA/BrxB family bacilliredoxin n=1 Tax=Mucilaginibacter sp. OK268 TaxID=1881048 RepID=UPI00087EA4A6|nr:BrxA/BrxB family bacilliredoxin [Mucilaginibacter sp. OK268]SDP98686.1 putative bacilliredoxin, YphP/YqiW family [Mucilaginibacter sp. OK268]
MPYSPLLIKPFRDEISEVGVQELLTPNDVDEIMKQTGTTLIFINSVCGCAAGTARPGIKLALEHDKKPDRVASVFAGQDLDATARFRTYVSDIPPSSPSFALFKDNELVYFIPKHRIESRDANSVANDLIAAFDEFC